MKPDTKAQIDSWTEPQPQKGKKAGRPRLREKRPTVRVGRPAGQRASQLELQEFMYSHPKKKKVVEEMMRAALDPEHKNQGIAWKLLMDRMLPISGFEKLAGKSAIQIIINTLDSSAVEIEGETIESVEEDAETA